MKPTYFRSQNTGQDRWMVSYLDVLTVLLILFVAIAAQQLQSAPKPPAPFAAVAPPIPAPGAALAAIQQELEQNHLEVQLDSRGIVVSLPQEVLFAPGQDRINADALPIVGAIGDVLRKIPNKVSLVGHADTVPIHNRRFSNNWELAAARSLRLLELLSGHYGIAESRLSVQSYGSYDAKSSNDTPDGRASNRRVEIVIQDRAPPSTP